MRELLAKKFRSINEYVNIKSSLYVSRCNLRFPSTNIRLYFQSLVDDPDEMDHVDDNSPSHTNASFNGGTTNSQVPGISDMKPLNINIPQPGNYSTTNSSAQPLKLIPNHHNHSPPSPTGTIRYVFRKGKGYFLFSYAFIIFP